MCWVPENACVSCQARLSLMSRGVSVLVLNAIALHYGTNAAPRAHVRAGAAAM
jgi:hypothetical protein